MTALEDPRRAPPVARARRVLPSAAAAARDLRTVRDLVRYACTCLEASGAMFGHGTDNAWDEAVWMVLWSLHLAPDQLDRVIDARLLPAERLAIAHLVQRRCTERVPAAYLTGEAWLRGHRFRCDARALVPRSLIAEALDEALDDWLDARAPERILDLCAGGGSLAILAALRFPDARVDASDLSRDALALARENRALFGLDDRIELVEGDLYGALDGRRYDLILCNPPYVNSGSMDTLPAEFRAEPQGALAGGRDGMDLIRPILTGAIDHFAPEGLLLLEIGHEAPFFEQAFPALEFAYLPVAAGDTLLVLVRRDQLVAAFPGPKR